MYYYVNILLTKNALNTFISNENNFVQNQLLRSADSISFSFIPVAYSALLCWSPASIDFNGAALNSFFQCLETRRSLDNADYVPPTDAQRLWDEWRSGLARTPSVCVMIGGSVISF